MAAITTQPTGAVAVAGTLAATAASDTFPTHFSWLGKGGWKSVDTLADLALITPARNEEGAACFVCEEANRGIYIYLNGNWGKLDISASSDSGSADGVNEDAVRGIVRDINSNEFQWVKYQSIEPAEAPADMPNFGLFVVSNPDGTKLYQKVNGKLEFRGELGGSDLPSGGTTGQVLVKQSGTDGDANWEDRNWIGYGSALPDTKDVPDGAVFFKGEGSPFALLRGVDGADGVSGFLPDYERFEIQNIIKNKTVEGSFDVYSGEAPYDGWCRLWFQSSNTSVFNMYFRVGTTTLYHHQAAIRQRSEMFPVRKGDIVNVVVTSGIAPTSVSALFIPIYKPELTEERVVAYLNGKPVYEVEVSGRSPSANNGTLYNAKDLNIKEIVSVFGTIEDSNDVFYLPSYFVSTSSFCRTRYNKATGTFIFAFAGSAFANALFRMTIRYTKTTD